MKSQISRLMLTYFLRRSVTERLETVAGVNKQHFERLPTNAEIVKTALRKICRAALETQPKTAPGKATIGDAPDG